MAATTTRFRVRLSNVSATGLPAKDTRTASSDPYFVFDFDRFKTAKSEVVKKCLAPQWQFEVTFFYETRYADRLAEKTCRIEVYDKDRWKADDFIGSVELDLHAIATGPVRHQLLLRGPKREPAGTLSFDLAMDYWEEITATLKDLALGADAVAEPFLQITFDSDPSCSIRTPVATTPAFWAELPQLSFHAQYQVLLRSGLLIDLYCNRTKSRIASATIPLSKFLKATVLTPFSITFSSPVGSGTLQGKLYLNKVPPFGQLADGIRTDTGIVGQKPPIGGAHQPLASEPGPSLVSSLGNAGTLLPASSPALYSSRHRLNNDPSTTSLHHSPSASSLPGQPVPSAPPMASAPEYTLPPASPEHGNHHSLPPSPMASPSGHAPHLGLPQAGAMYPFVSTQPKPLQSHPPSIHGGVSVSAPLTAYPPNVPPPGPLQPAPGYSTGSPMMQAAYPPATNSVIPPGHSPYGTMAPQPQTSPYGTIMGQPFPPGGFPMGPPAVAPYPPMQSPQSTPTFVSPAPYSAPGPPGMANTQPPNHFGAEVPAFIRLQYAQGSGQAAPSGISYHAFPSQPYSTQFGAPTPSVYPPQQMHTGAPAFSPHQQSPYPVPPGAQPLNNSGAYPGNMYGRSQ